MTTRCGREEGRVSERRNSAKGDTNSLRAHRSPCSRTKHPCSTFEPWGPTERDPNDGSETRVANLTKVDVLIVEVHVDSRPPTQESESTFPTRTNLPQFVLCPRLLFRLINDDRNSREHFDTVAIASVGFSCISVLLYLLVGCFRRGLLDEDGFGV